MSRDEGNSSRITRTLSLDLGKRQHWQSFVHHRYNDKDAGRKRTAKRTEHNSRPKLTARTPNHFCRAGIKPHGPMLRSRQPSSTLTGNAPRTCTHARTKLSTNESLRPPWSPSPGDSKKATGHDGEEKTTRKQREKLRLATSNLRLTDEEERQKKNKRGRQRGITYRTEMLEWKQ